MCPAQVLELAMLTRLTHIVRLGCHESGWRPGTQQVPILHREIACLVQEWPRRCGPRRPLVHVPMRQRKRTAKTAVHAKDALPRLTCL
jgi:hypothetical protein